MSDATIDVLIRMTLSIPEHSLNIEFQKDAALKTIPEIGDYFPVSHFICIVKDVFDAPSYGRPFQKLIVLESKVCIDFPITRQEGINFLKKEYSRLKNKEGWCVTLCNNIEEYL